MKTRTKVIVAVLVTSILATIAYYWRKTALINAIVVKYGNVTWTRGGYSFQVAKSTLEKFNIFQLQTILEHGESSAVLYQ